MERLRRHPGALLAVLAVAGVVLAVVLAVVTYPDAGSAGPVAAPDRSAGADDADPEGASDGKDDDGDPLTVERATSKGRGGFSSSSGLGPGLQGAGGTLGAPRHELTLTVTSREPIGTVGYVVPTSVDDSYGTAKEVGTSWTLSTVVYGRPDYAQVFVQAGGRGVPITCTVTVDGEVTDQRSTDGPSSVTVCQG